MNSQLTIYVVMTFLSGALNLYLACYVYMNRHRYKHSTYFFMAYAAAIAVYCFGSGFGLLAETIEQIKFWTVIQYIGISVSPVVGLMFVMNYLGITLSRKKILTLLIVPIITLVIVATNEWHHLQYKVLEIDPVLGAPYVLQEAGIWYVVHAVYMSSCMVTTLLVALSHWKEVAEVYRAQLFSVILSQLLFMVTSFGYLMGFTPHGIDPLPMVLWLSSLLYLWSINSSPLFVLMPIAKDAIFNSMNDGVIVLDDSMRLIEFNQTSKLYFPQLDRTFVGKDFHEIWYELSGNELSLELELINHTQEIELANDETKRVYQIRTSPLVQVKNSKGIVLIFSDVTELKKLQNKLHYQANYDELTQLYNRRAFMKYCKKDLETAEQSASAFTVMLMDIDHFKEVNDTYGHHIGDQVLQYAVEVCKKYLLEGQVFARYGGEEFAFYLSGYTAKEAEELGNNMRKDLAQQVFRSSKGDIPVTFSMGVAESSHETIETTDQLLNKADKALYAAKQAGRNQVQVYAEQEERAS